MQCVFDAGYSGMMEVYPHTGAYGGAYSIPIRLYNRWGFVLC